VIINESSDSHMIILKEIGGERVLPIPIGLFEATSIDQHIRNQTAERPRTHELLASTIDRLGGDLQDVTISELRDNTYFARLRIRHDGGLVEVDSRPSDAIALAVLRDVPIFVGDDTLS
jgi:bifunctional DNase/RNase